MRSDLRERLLQILLPLALIGLAGCLFQTSDDRVAGGAEDFPNTVALGAAVSSHISDNGDWDQFSVIPSILPSFKDAGDSLVVPPDSLPLAQPKSAAGAGKFAAQALAASNYGASVASSSAADTVTWDFSDTASLNVARRIHVQDGLLKIHRDTTVYRWDAKAKDGIAGNELILESRGADIWRLSGRIQAYRYENLDSAGGFDRATFYERIPALDGSFKNRILVMLPGPDGDMSTQSDNRPAYYGFARTGPAAAGAPQDTIESFSIVDADGDGVLWGAGDSGLVDFMRKTPNPLHRPAVDLVVQKMRGFLFKEEQKTYPISYSETRTEKDGKKVTFSVKGTLKDSAFDPGDTAVVSQNVIYPQGSDMVEKHSRYRVVLGGQPKRFQDNKLIRYTVQATWRKNPLTVTTLTLTPDQPVLSTNLAVDGDVQVDADFADSTTGMAVGHFQDKVITVDLTHKTRAGKERRFHIRWDSQAGAVLSQTPLN